METAAPATENVVQTLFRKPGGDDPLVVLERDRAGEELAETELVPGLTLIRATRSGRIRKPSARAPRGQQEIGGLPRLDARRRSSRITALVTRPISPFAAAPIQDGRLGLGTGPAVHFNVRNRHAVGTHSGYERVRTSHTSASARTVGDAVDGKLRLELRQTTPPLRQQLQQHAQGARDRPRLELRRIAEQSAPSASRFQAVSSRSPAASSSRSRWARPAMCVTGITGDRGQHRCGPPAGEHDGHRHSIRSLRLRGLRVTDQP